MDLRDQLAAHSAAVDGMVQASSDVIIDIAERLIVCFRAGGKVLICGNGGSAADAQHFAAEFVNRFRANRSPWPAISLVTDTSVLTSIANNSDFTEVFARQVEALGRPGDVLIVLSTSGTSANVVAALRTGRDRGLLAIGFTGAAGAERLAGACDVVLSVPSDDTARIQEAHGFAYHVIAGMVEEQLAAS